MHALRTLLFTLAAGIGSISLAAAPGTGLDRFGRAEDIDPSFGWQPGAQCTFTDRMGVVLRSDSMNRNWVKVNGNQVEVNAPKKIREDGWFQVLTAPNLSIEMRLSRVMPEPVGGDGYSLVGEIVITRSGEATTYQVTGGCGA